MAERIPQSVSYLVVFRAFLASDGKTPATGKTIAITISKNGGAFGNPNAGATNATEISSGFYKFTLDTTDTGTLGPLAWRGAEGTINDAGDVLTVAKATNGGFSGVPDAAADAPGGLPISDAGGLDLDAKLANTNEVTAARMGALTDWINGGRLDLILDDILLDTAEIGPAGAGLTNINLPNQTMDIVGNITGNLSGSVGSVTGAVGSVTGNVGGNVTGTVGGFTAGAKAEIESEVNDALVAQRLDELLNADSDIDGAAPPTVGSVFHELMSKTAGSFSFDQTTDSLEAIRDRGDAAWVTATGFSTLDAAGVRAAVGLAAANLDTQLGDIPTVAEFEARTLVAAGYATPTNITAGTITTVTNLTNAPTVGDLTNAMKASVNAEVVDCLNVDTYAEIGQEAPAATNTIRKMLGYLFKSWRNKKTQTATERKLYADDGTTVDQKATDSDDGTTFSKGEVGTGP